MNKKQLLQLRDDVEAAFEYRKASGDFDANSGHMRLLLSCVGQLIDHAIATLPKPIKK